MSSEPKKVDTGLVRVIIKMMSTAIKTCRVK